MLKNIVLITWGIMKHSRFFVYNLTFRMFLLVSASIILCFQNLITRERLWQTKILKNHLTCFIF